jgi:hypothetical protein
MGLERYLKEYLNKYTDVQLANLLTFGSPEEVRDGEYRSAPAHFGRDNFWSRQRLLKHALAELEIDEQQAMALIELENKNNFEKWLNDYKSRGFYIDRVDKLRGLFTDEGGLRLEPVTVFFGQKNYRKKVSKKT